MKPLLVVLAAGMGSRYGGCKQLDPIGPNGETLLEYAVYDALRTGFGQVLFVIRRDIESLFQETLLSRMKSVPYTVAYQDLDTGIPPEALEKAQEAGRTAPWGTVHALLCGAGAITVPAFAVIHGDAFYGRPGFEVMGTYLGSPAVTQQKLPTIKQGYIVPYPLEKTLKAEGTAARTLCEFADERLVSLTTIAGIGRDETSIIRPLVEKNSQEELNGNTPVSMDFWGFPRSILPSLRKYFFDFLQIPEHLAEEECHLPDAVDWIIKNGLLTVRALPADTPWFGMTDPEDRESAANRIAQLTEDGHYPAPLWE